MNPTREEALFALAVEKSPEKRADFLDGACHGDPALRQRLQARLAEHEQPEDVLGVVLAATTVKGNIKLDLAAGPDEAVGQTLGRYKLLERVGEGGCGVVYVAEQTEPVRRRVALKVIKLGMDTKQVVARFEAERQALAMMDHPNIAKVLDAGTTEVGRPYFVMELVRGIRITDYCDQANLSTKERLDLFIKVCQAIQHAHQKGIIHRDIKPSNILVTLHDGVPVPKVIDFGIAKATEGRLTDNTVYTQLHQFIGTPAYMSPEQAEMSGLDIDTRSDIYSLGVLLYELLAGSTPFDANELMKSGIDAMRKTIREKEPMRPSTRFATLKGEELTSTAKRRSVDTSKLIHQLKGDLDWIVMKCLEKDRARRYETANGLAADLKRHLGNEPVMARPASAAYRLQKAFRRNKLAFAAAAAVALALLGGALVSSWQAVRASQAEQVQRSLRHEAELARGNEAKQRTLAEGATARESNLRQEAVVSERKSRLRAYAADMNLAHHAAERHDIGRAQEILDRYRPSAGEEDLRGWEWRYLWKFCRSDAQYRLFRRPEGVDQNLSISHDGRSMVTGGGNSPMVYLDLITRQPATAPWKQEKSMSAVFSPTEPLVAATFATGSGTELRLFETRTGRTRWALTNIQAEMRRIAFSADGSVILGIGSATFGRRLERHLYIWQVSNGTMVSLLKSPLLNANRFFATETFLGDHRLLLVSDTSAPTTLLRMDALSGATQWSNNIGNVILSLAISPDSRWIVTGGGFGDGTIHILDALTGQEAVRLAGHLLYVHKLLFLDEGRILASASADRTIRLWDFEKRQLIGILHGHREEVWDLAALPDGKSLVSSSFDGEILVWNRQTAARRTTHVTLPRRIPNWQFTDDEGVVGVSQGAEILRWSGRDLIEEKSLALVPGQSIGLWSASSRASTNRSGILLPDNGNWAVWVSADGSLYAQELREPLREPRLISSESAGDSRPLWLVSNRNQLFTSRYAAGGNHLDLWDFQSGKLIRSWSLGPIDNFVMSPGGEIVLGLHNQGGRSRLLNVITGEELELAADKISSIPITLFDAAFSPDTRILAVATEPHVVRLWESPSFKELTPLGGHMMGAKSVAFSPDGRRIATASGNFESLKIWDAESHLELLTLRGEVSAFTRTRFSPEGNRIGTGDGDGVVNIWEAPSWVEISAAEAKDKTAIRQP